MPNLVSILLVIGLGPEAHCVCCSLVAVKQREPEDDESDTFALTVVCDFEKVAPRAIRARGQLNLELHAANQESTFLLMIYDFWGKQSTTTHFYYLQAHMNQIQPNIHCSNITHTDNIRSQGVWERRTSCDFAISVASSSHKKLRIEKSRSVAAKSWEPMGTFSTVSLQHQTHVAVAFRVRLLQKPCVTPGQDLVKNAV